MQPIIKSAFEVEYAFKQISPTNLSLKNSCFFRYQGNEYIAATDMLRGGTVILTRGAAPGGWVEYMHCFKGYTMMWAPYPFIDDSGNLWIYCCDTGGGDVSVWGEHMRLYRHSVDLAAKKHGKLIKVDVSANATGFIDPAIMRIGKWYYLFYVNLWNDQSKEWWDPCYSVSNSPFGPFRESVNLQVPERGIDEAFKPIIDCNGGLWCTWSSGDSGVDGKAFFGRLDVVGQHKDGWLYFRAAQESIIRATDSNLCTALDWNDGRLFATLRAPGYTGMRDKFYTGKMA